MTVKRYSILDSGGWADVDAHESVNGEWVTYEDYETLLTENKRLKAENDMLKADICNMAANADDYEARELNYRDEIKRLNAEIEREVLMFKGKLPLDNTFIELLQGNREELVKWLGRCAWHCNKVNEMDVENERLKAACERKDALLRRLEWVQGETCLYCPICLRAEGHHAADCALSAELEGLK
jgi:hypothetical protein